MKKIAEFFYILFRALFQAMTWVVLAMAVISCVFRILELDQTELYQTIVGFVTMGLGFAESVLELDVSPYVDKVNEVLAEIWAMAEGSAMMLLIVGIVGAFIFRFVQDFVDKRKPVYMGLVEMTAEISAWIVKCAFGYICVNVACQGISWVLHPEIFEALPDTVSDIIRYLADSVSTPLTMVYCFGALCLITTVVFNLVGSKKAA